MGLNDTPVAERRHIAFFGCRNAGKSSLLNAVTGQKMAIVSEIKGTTTDPVSKTMELLPAGPVVIIDTPGLDDEGELGAQRIEKALQVLRRTDVAVLVADATLGLRSEDELILQKIRERSVPHIVVMNKADLVPKENRAAEALYVSALKGEGIFELKERIAAVANETAVSRPLVRDLVNAHDVVLLVIPIDKAAPKGRLILPQQEVIRDLLDCGAVPVLTRDSELADTLAALGGLVRLVITDSQAFKKVAGIVPREIPLTSFSILFSRYKGELSSQLRGVAALDALKAGDRVLIAEGCTHHRQCGDIGTEKIPAMLRQFAGCEIAFDFTSGQEFPADLSAYKVVIHCGGCMLNEREMRARIRMAEEAGVPITNYGMVIAKATGILERSMEPLEKA